MFTRCDGFNYFCKVGGLNFRPKFDFCQKLRILCSVKGLSQMKLFLKNFSIEKKDNSPK